VVVKPGNFHNIEKINIKKSTPKNKNFHEKLKFVQLVTEFYAFTSNPILTATFISARQKTLS